MKNILTSIMLLGGILTAQAQAYLLEVNTGTYTSLDSGITVWGGVNNVPFSSDNIHFETPFYIGNKADSVNNVGVSRSGIHFYSGGFTYTLDGCGSINNSPEDVAVPFVSEAKYRVAGVEGNRILQFEFKDVAIDSFEMEFFNYQIWYYEQNNVIEYRYGVNSLSSQHVYNTGYLFVFAGLMSESNTYQWIVNPGGNPSNPSVNYVMELNTIISINSMPTEGTIYRFYPNTNGIDNSNFDDYFTVKSSNGTLTVSSQQETIKSYSLVSINGQVVSASKAAGDKRARINTQSLQSGIYLLKIETEKGQFVKKLML
ncbi:MAG: hypothetical protein ACJAUV_002054 [Flavobacteriales bacterium]|jgi:hypothetical protein